ncbi:MAG: hypothetical protein HXK82_00610 [Lachnospiraceae bacterium]|jgi:hypothetical protein|nr:hypothetical protein [Lachnospiraceae bacterium]
MGVFDEIGKKVSDASKGMIPQDKVEEVVSNVKTEALSGVESAKALGMEKATSALNEVEDKIKGAISDSKDQK